MTDTILALVPTYGIYLIFITVMLSCLALPLPSSLMVLTSGGFVAAGEMTWISTILAAFAGFVVGDQVTYRISKHLGGGFLHKMKAKEARKKLIERAEHFMQRFGIVAVFLSRTIVSPLGPYVGYISGASGLKWLHFTAAAIPAAGLWATAYVSLGYMFAGHISDLSSLLSKGLGFVAAGGIAIGALMWIIKTWRDERHKFEAQDVT